MPSAFGSSATATQCPQPEQPGAHQPSSCGHWYFRYRRRELDGKAATDSKPAHIDHPGGGPECAEYLADFNTRGFRQRENDCSDTCDRGCCGIVEPGVTERCADVG